MSLFGLFSTSTGVDRGKAMQACLLEGKQDSLNLRRVDLAPLHDFGQNGREQVFRYAIFETTFLCLYKLSASHICQGITD